MLWQVRREAVRLAKSADEAERRSRAASPGRASTSKLREKTEEAARVAEREARAAEAHASNVKDVRRIDTVCGTRIDIEKRAATHVYVPCQVLGMRFDGIDLNRDGVISRHAPHSHTCPMRGRSVLELCYMAGTSSGQRPCCAWPRASARRPCAS